jgi:HTH-type transcriptional regulator/antitoxin HigA
LVHAYEENHYPVTTATGVDVLKFIMEEHQLSHSAFPELGSEESVAALLAGKRELSVENIRALSKRFDLSPATFF